MKLLVKIKNLVYQNPIYAAEALLFSISVILYITGYINQNITGEALYDFQYADRYPWQLGWKIFFFNRVLSRLMHGVFVSFLYNVFGYDPPVFYLVALVLQISTSVLIASVIKNFIKEFWVLFLVIVTLTLFPLGMENVLALKEIHHALAWFLFWLAVWFFKKWIVNKSLISLAGSTLAFILAVLSYEVVIALLPLSVLLVLDYLKDAKDFIKKLALTIFVTFSAGTVVVIVDRIKKSGRLSGMLFSDSSTGPDLQQKIIHYLLHLPVAIWHDGLFSAFYTPGVFVSLLSKTIIACSVVIAVIGAMMAIVKARRSRKLIFSAFHDHCLILLLCGIYLSVAGYLPYGIANIERNVDSLQGASIGLILIALGGVIAVERMGRQRLSRIFIGLICLFWIFVGGINYMAGQRTSRAKDMMLSNFVYSIKQIVPFVRENTTFIFVNAGFSRTGDIGLMNMLYGRNNLRCIHLFDYDKEETYTREPNLLVEDTGSEYEPDFIILTFDEEGRASLIESLTYEEYPNVPITWVVDEPILTNHDRILETIEGAEPTTPFYAYMTKFRLKMGW